MFEIKVPAAGESITEADLSEWLKKDGEFVNTNDALLILETDKASMDICAETSGILKIKVQEGETVTIGQVLGEIIPGEAPKNAPVENKVEEKAPVSKQVSEPENKDTSKRSSLSPAVKKIVEEKNIDPLTVEGTGKQGRIKKGDLLDLPNSTTPNYPTSLSTPETKEVPAVSEGKLTRKKMSRLRQTISKRLLESQQTTASLTTFNEIDMTEVMKLRSDFKEQFEKKHQTKLGFMGFFVKACIEALKEYPVVNASIDGTDILYKDEYHIGIAIGTDKGLVVPVLKNAQDMSIANVEKGIKSYATKARDGKIEISDLSGGTFTITNGGVYGSLMSTPILNPPQSGIIGLHKIEKRPVVFEGEIRIRPMMYVALTYDHRLIDGSDSVKFLVKVKESIENPSRLFLEL